MITLLIRAGFGAVKEKISFVGLTSSIILDI